ncbi:MAG: aminotransferase class V-fold PLP-dependent enzyme, partial [Bacilli bacterium]
MTIDKVRKDFPILKKKFKGKPFVYFDNASTSLKPTQVVQAMNTYYHEFPVNAGRGEYDLAYRLEQAIDVSRQTVANFIRAQAKEIIFTTGTTMGLNMIAQSFAQTYLQPGDEIIMTESEHAANVLPWYQVAETTGAKIIILDLDEHQRLTPALLKSALTKKTKMVAFAEVSNVLGTRNDVKTLTQMAHEAGALVVLDGAQSVPHLPTNVQDTDVDFLVFS